VQEGDPARLLAFLSKAVPRMVRELDEPVNHALERLKRRAEPKRQSRALYHLESKGHNE
jgi:hypothetical protein